MRLFKTTSEIDKNLIKTLEDEKVILLNEVKQWEAKYERSEVFWSNAYTNLYRKYAKLYLRLNEVLGVLK